MKHDFKILSSTGKYHHDVSVWSDTRYGYCHSSECDAKRFGHQCHAVKTALALVDAAANPCPVFESALLRSPFAATATGYDWNAPHDGDADHLTLEAALNAGHMEMGDCETDDDEPEDDARRLSNCPCGKCDIVGDGDTICPRCKVSVRDAWSRQATPPRPFAFYLGALQL